MADFKEVIEDFTATMDALRDFVSGVGPVLTERQEQERKKVGESRIFQSFLVALLLSDETLEPLGMDEETKKTISKVRKLLIASQTAASDEKAAKLRDKIQEVVPIKIVENRIELNFEHDSAPEFIAQHKAIAKLKKEIGLLRESALMALTSRSEWFIAQLLHLYFHKYPEAAGMSEPFFSLDTLRSLQTIDEAREVLLLRAVN